MAARFVVECAKPHYEVATMKYAIKNIVCLALAVSTLIVLPVVAGDSTTIDVGRYTMSKTANGLVRLDTKTGQVSHCTASSAGLACKIAADERRAYQQEIDAVNNRLNNLQSRLSTLEKDVRSGKFARAEKRLPTQAREEFERALEFADKAFRHFFNLFEELHDKPEKDAI